MKDYDKKIEKKLGDLGVLLRSLPSITKNGMCKIEQAEQVKPPRSVTLIPTLIKSGLGLVACLLITAILWFSIVWPTNITLADVHKSIESKTWVLISYDDGTKEWANLNKRLCFVTYKNSLNFYVGMRDHVNGIWRAYHSNWGQQIHEEIFTVRPYPQTPWEYAVCDWDDRGISQFSNKTIEKSPDTIDGRKVVRFDTYNVGPLGIRSLVQQVWANPETRLPIRIRKYSAPDKFKTGDFSFPQTGPSSIYDLNAPQGLKVVRNWGITEPARTIIDAAKQARQHLPDKMRIVRKSKYSLDIYYRCDNKLRYESYGKTDGKNSTPLPIEPPETYEHIREWATDNLALVHLLIYDGEYEYDFDKAPWKTEAKLHVEYRNNDWLYTSLRISEQWPYTHNVGPITVLEDEPGTPPGCVLLRYEGMGLRRDWYIDPSRDYICVKRVEFRKDQDTGRLTLSSEVERTNFTRLPSGQWYGRTIKSQGKKVAEYDVKLLTDAELENLTGKDDSAGFFDGEKLLKNAMDNGIKVSFWAR
jgi:hypothetical protein